MLVEQDTSHDQAIEAAVHGTAYGVGDGAEANDAPHIDAKDGFVPYRRPNLAGPFPTLRCREIVKGIVEAVVETTAQVKMTDVQAHWFALGIVRGARIVAQQDEDATTERFVVELLDQLNRGGVAAIRELVEAVNTAAAA